MPLIKKIMSAVYGIVQSAGSAGVPINAPLHNYPAVQSAVQGFRPPVLSHKRKKHVEKAIHKLIDSDMIYVKLISGQLCYVAKQPPVANQGKQSNTGITDAHVEGYFNE